MLKIPRKVLKNGKTGKLLGNVQFDRPRVLNRVSRLPRSLSSRGLRQVGVQKFRTRLPTAGALHHPPFRTPLWYK
eukprot:3816139-Amphidinium_carterae.1